MTTTPSEEIIAALIAKMTLEEKIGQLTMATSDSATTGPDVRRRLPEAVKAGRVGSVFNLWGREAVLSIQRSAVEESRLGIPLFFGLDVLHGFRTIFPIPLGEAGSFDPDLWTRTAAAAAGESAEAGLHLTFAPMLDVSRDPRWGRCCESPGEDTLVAAQFATAKLRGLQGSAGFEDETIAAVPKHFVAYGAVTAGRDYASADVSRRSLEEIHLPPFRAAISANAAAIMVAFTALNGVPMTANRELVHGVLREKWGFDGVVISDYGAVGELIKHGIAADLAHASSLALRAGIDIDMMSFGYESGLAAALDRGLVELREIDAAVFRVLGLKARLGLFEDPYRRCHKVGDKENRKGAPNRHLARDAACRSLVLLKNESELLPISTRHSRIALIGPLADAPHEMLGPWSAAGCFEEVVPILAGLRAALPNCEISFSQGVPITDDEPNTILEALALARSADLVILGIGESASMSGEAASRAKLELPGRQGELAAAIIGTGRPVVVLLFSGRPICVPEVFAGAGAVLACWFPGTEAGNAVADILTGRVSPTARLAMTWPRHVGQVPLYFAELSGGRPEEKDNRYTSKYLDLPNSPEFPFGHGLGYTDFAFDNLSIELGSAIRVKFRARNLGPTPGETTVFIFVRDLVAPIARPLLALRRFLKIALSAFEDSTVTVDLTPLDLAILDLDFRPRFEAGEFEVLIGPSADQGKLITARFQLDGVFDLSELSFHGASNRTAATNSK